ncbi:MAG: ATP-binding cassette domain-containing protein [Lachnospiraceae bacterium]|nr:ATP-binding cassette domain-containing protein [Lachnospiraceae bacterium]
MNEAIVVKELTKIFTSKDGDVTAADHISFEVEKGDIFGIIGLSGAGKSTLVRCLNLLEKPTSGEVIVNGQSLETLSKKDLRLARRKIGMIFQHFNLLMQRTALQNVCFPLEIAGVPKKEARARAMEYLRTVGLEDKANAYPSQLSGGQKQRVAIARVLASDPEILLSDEATSALDPETTRSILALLREINEKMGITIVLITHEMAVVQEICRNVLVLENGKLAEEGSVEELFHSPKTEAARRLLVNAGQPIEKMEGGRFIRLSFQEFSAFEPVIGNAILKFRTPVNVLYADTHRLSGKVNGQMIVELPPDQEIAEQMIAFFREKQLGVEDWTNDER